MTQRQEEMFLLDEIDDEKCWRCFVQSGSITISELLDDGPGWWICKSCNDAVVSQIEADKLSKEKKRK